MKTENKHLKSLIQEIAGYTSIGRIYEVDTRKNIEGEEEDPSQIPADGQVKKPSTPPAPTPALPEPKAPASPQPKEDPQTEPEVPSEDPEEDDNSIEDSEREQAEAAIDSVSFVKLNSDAGTKYLLNAILQPAMETNTMDTVAQDFAEKLNIKTPEDLEKFKENSIQFNSVIGFSQLLNSMGSFVNG
jgi:type IV secretory pathway VirB10-like protein